MNTTTRRNASSHLLAAALGASALLMALGSLPAHAQQPKSKTVSKASAAKAELFGMPLKGAQREALRAALRNGGLAPTREDDHYWVDLYDASGVLDGASEFAAGYVFATGQFAYAQYTFRGFMDTALVSRVADMVIRKYGQPARREGNAGLGEVKYQWNLAEGMRIEVSRGWPDTTTYLTYSDPKARAVMLAEQTARSDQMDQEKARAQSHAF